VHFAAKFQFERVARELARWQAVPEAAITSASVVTATRL